MTEKRTPAGLERKKAYNAQYAREKLKRIPLDVPKKEYETFKAAAERAGESVNGYIRRAVRERLERDGLSGEGDN